MFFHFYRGINMAKIKNMVEKQNKKHRPPVGGSPKLFGRENSNIWTPKTLENHPSDRRSQYQPN